MGAGGLLLKGTQPALHLEAVNCSGLGVAEGYDALLLFCLELISPDLKLSAYADQFFILLLGTPKSVRQATGLQKPNYSVCLALLHMPNSSQLVF